MNFETPLYRKSNDGCGCDNNFLDFVESQKCSYVCYALLLPHVWAGPLESFLVRLPARLLHSFTRSLVVVDSFLLSCTIAGLVQFYWFHLTLFCCFPSFFVYFPIFNGFLRLSHGFHYFPVLFCLFFFLFFLHTVSFLFSMFTSIYSFFTVLYSFASVSLVFLFLFIYLFHFFSFFSLFFICFLNSAHVNFSHTYFTVLCTTGTFLYTFEHFSNI